MGGGEWSSLAQLRTVILGGVGPIELDGTEWTAMDLSELIEYYTPVPNYEGTKIVSLKAPDGTLIELCALGAAVANTTVGMLKKLANTFNNCIVEFDPTKQRKRKASAGVGSSDTYHEGRRAMVEPAP